MLKEHLEIKEINFEQAENLVQNFHYSGKLPKNVRKNYGMFFCGLLVGAACYGPCVSRKVPSDWLELRRLVRVPGVDFTLSQFLSKTIKILKKECPAILSWADPEQDHHGGIYQATNWIYTEQKGGGNHTFINEKGEHIHPRTVYSWYGTQSVPIVLAINPHWSSFLPKTKHRYLMPCKLKKKECLQILKTKQLPYPKPDRSL